MESALGSDERGVDITQIRELLGLTLIERVAEMVRACNVVLDVQAHVGAAPGRSAH